MFNGNCVNPPGDAAGDRRSVGHPGLLWVFTGSPQDGGGKKWPINGREDQIKRLERKLKTSCHHDAPHSLQSRINRVRCVFHCKYIINVKMYIYIFKTGY